ncbi:MAG: gliding motility-associated C-terminal domain-containing protein [Bacteroidales bacterium]|nr:gliding motility-associated C-terminal domain-containing protein [Bacteroidales bacterium]
MKKLIAVFWLLSLLMAAQALGRPEIRCLEVRDNGDVLVSWVAPADLSGFLRYEVYYATEATNPFALVGTVSSSSTLTFLHTGANAVVQPHCYYYVRAVGNNGSFDSETISTIEFYLSNSGTGLAVLNWSAPAEQPLPSYASQYQVWKDYPSGNWNELAEVQGLVYRDTIDVCDAVIAYRVELADASGCRNVSRPQSERFTDMTAPAIPDLDSVTVDESSQRIRLGWEVSLSPDVFAYIIYLQENGVWIPIDTVYGRTTTQWTDTEHDPQSEVFSYRIATLDSCLNSSPMTMLQKSMQLTATYDLCRREAYLSWTDYENMPRDLAKYQIYCSRDGGPMQMVGESTSQSYTYAGLIANSTYVFLVRAVNSDGQITASSVKADFVFSSADNMDFVYVRSVSVNETSDAIVVTAYTGPTVTFTKVHLYRSVDDDAHFSKYQTLSYNGTDTYTFTDVDVDCNQRLYYYKATIENECDMETAESNVSHNIILRGSTNPSHQNSMNWMAYDGWNGGVSSYTVKRRTETAMFESDVMVTPLRSCTDDVSELTNEGSIFTYCIVAQENNNEYGFADQSRSNSIQLVQSPTIYVPNAFNPAGINNIFKPVSTFMPTEDYYMLIFGRNGQMVFNTADPNEGWDGTCKGQEMPIGVYIYKIKYLYEGQYYEKSGTVTLIK